MNQNGAIPHRFGSLMSGFLDFLDISGFPVKAIRVFPPRPRNKIIQIKQL